MMSTRLEGLVAATFSPMRADGSLDLGVAPGLVDQLLDDGVTGLFVAGSTGEGESLTTDERRDSARVYVEAAAGRLPVVVQVGCNSLRQARSLATHAREDGADAISALPPSYFKPRSVDALADSLAEIASGAPELPLYYYHIPGLTGVEIDVVALLERSATRVPSLVGVKFSKADLAVLQSCIAFDGGRFDILFGCDEMLLAGLVSGARAAVGSTYNFAAPLYRRVIDAVQRGDLEAARAEQIKAVRMVDVMVRHGGLPAIKATMALVGRDCGPVRLPQRALDDAQREALRLDLEALGFFGGRV